MLLSHKTVPKTIFRQVKYGAFKLKKRLTRGLALFKLEV